METIVEKKPRKVRKDKGIKRGPRKPKEIVTLAPKVEPAKPTLALVDTFLRGPLIEGRTYGVAFALCKREGDVVTTVGPISPCKDYMNDQLYSEQTGKPYGAYGYKSKKCGIFDGVHGYVVMAILPNKYDYGEKYPKDLMDREIAQLNDHSPSVQYFINFMENHLNVDGRTTLTKVGDNRIIAQIPNYWCRYTYLISLWSTIVRIAVESFWKAENITKSPLDIINNCTTTDADNMEEIKPKLEKLKAGIVPVQDFTKSVGWHDEGIVSYEFPS